MKLNWGKGIFIAYGLFAAGVLIMVAVSISKKTDLVATNYYEKEIKYQEEIDRIKNTNELKEQVNFEAGPSELKIQFPPGGTPASGDINFYRPSDSDKDFKLKISADKDSKQLIDLSNMDKGLWRVKIFWSMDGKSYLSTTSFIKQ